MFIFYLINLIIFIAEFYYVANLSEFVKQKVKNCEPCARATPQILHAPLRPILTKRNMQLVEVDYFGPMPMDPLTGARYFVFHTIFVIFSYLFIFIDT